ncbi:MAG: hypothetical protein R3C05_28590 [Pirellulaceae bacterium]
MATKRFIRLTTVALLVLSFSTAIGWADDSSSAVEDIQQGQPEFFVHAEVNHGNHDYREG